EPCAQVFAHLRRILLPKGGVACDLPRGSQRWNLQAKTHHRLAVCGKVVGIRFAIAPDIRSAGILRVWPPVVAFGVEIMRSTGASRRVGCSYSDWLLIEVRVCRAHYPFAIDGRDIHYRRSIAPCALCRNHYTCCSTKFSTIHFASSATMSHE